MNIVFYDGECGLCQRSVSILARWDKQHVLSFAPLNGETYKSLLKESSDMTTVVYYSNGALFTMSDAIIEVGRTIGGWKSLFILLKIIPRFIRDFVYKMIAGQRKKVSCVILIKDERFLN